VLVGYGRVLSAFSLLVLSLLRRLTVPHRDFARAQPERCYFRFLFAFIFTLPFSSSVSRLSALSAGRFWGNCLAPVWLQLCEGCAQLRRGRNRPRLAEVVPLGFSPRERFGAHLLNCPHLCSNGAVSWK